MNYCGLNLCDTANGEGIRVSVFVSGCDNRCHGCFNKETWDFSFGNAFTESVMQQILNGLEKDYVTGLSILGGEPLHSRNRGGTANIIHSVKREYGNKKNIWVWTGYIYEHLLKDAGTDAVLKYILETADVLVDGPFMESEKDLTLEFRGSRNQRILRFKHD